MRERVQVWAGNLVILAVAAAIAYASSWFGKRSARAAVDVRPNLATVGLADAFFTGHAMDWLWYHAPAVMTVLMFSIFVGGAVVAIVLNR